MSAPIKGGVPPATSIVPSPHEELVKAVQHWVHFDNLAETLTKQVTNARNMRAEFETKVLTLLEAQNMKHAVLQIKGATLQRASRYKASDLTWAFVEQQLHDYYKSRGRPDETPQIMEFMQKHRGGKTQDYLKRSTPVTKT
jgi:hypothetical protein